jgi:predicted Rossmann fold nucleotide-binding protein DprA/Smf involved in DNA uptake
VRRRKIAFVCSIACPGDIIIKPLEIMSDLRKADVSVVGGFHSPMERECLRTLLRGTCGIIVCPARSVNKMRIPAEYRPALVSDRLLIVSPFQENIKRKTAENAELRNRFVATISDVVLIAHASPGGRTETFSKELSGHGKPLFTIKSHYNATLVADGALPVQDSAVLVSGS